MDRAVLSELITNQLAAIQQRLKDENNPVLLARLLRARAELIEKYIRIMIGNKNLAQMLSDYSEQKTRQDIEKLLRAQEGFEDLHNQIVEAAKTEDISSFAGLLYTGNRVKQVIALIDRFSHGNGEDIDQLELNGIIAKMRQTGTNLFVSGYVFDKAASRQELGEFIAQRAQDTRFSDKRPEAIIRILDEMREQHAPELDNELAKIAAISRQKGADILVIKQRIKNSSDIAVSGETMAQILDILGGRIVVNNLNSLETVMTEVEKFYAGRILSKDNYLLRDPAVETPQAMIKYIIQTGNDQCFELEVKTEQAIIISELSRYQKNKSRQLGWNFLGSEMNVYLEAIGQEKENAATLEISQRIRTELEAKGKAVVLGAPGSGKTEQLNIALSGRTTKTVDIREIFFEQVKTAFENNWDGFSQAYKTDPALKQQEADWLSEKVDSLYTELLQGAKQGDVVVLDEFDLAMQESLNDDELNTAKIIVDLADRLIKNGRNVVLIIHHKGKRTPAFMQHLKAKGFTDLIETGYLSEGEEKAILNVALKEKEKINDFLAQAEGVPAAYLGFMSHAGNRQTGIYRRNYNQLVAEAQSTISKAYRVAKLTGDARIAELLYELASGEKGLDDGEVRNQQEGLLETGLIGMRNGVMVMPKLVRDAIYFEERPVFGDEQKLEQLNTLYENKIRLIRSKEFGDVVFADMVDRVYPELLGILSPGRTAVILDSHPEHPVFAEKENVVSQTARLEQYKSRLVPDNSKANYMLFDHHYEGKLADGRNFLNVTTTLLTLEYVEHLLRQEDEQALKELQEGVIFANHRDPDIVLAGFVIRFIAEYKRNLTDDKFEKLVTLLKDTSIYNDHMLSPQDPARKEEAQTLEHVIDYAGIINADYDYALKLVKKYVDDYLVGVSFENMDEEIKKAVSDKRAQLQAVMDKLHKAFQEGRQIEGDNSGMWLDHEHGILVVDIGEDVEGPAILEYLNSDKFSVFSETVRKNIKLILMVESKGGENKRFKLRLMPEFVEKQNLFPLYTALNSAFANILGEEKFAGRGDAGGSPRLGIPATLEEVLGVLRQQLVSGSSRPEISARPLDELMHDNLINRKETSRNDLLIGQSI
ncbi:MAG: hypothetical protein KKB82_06625 [Candidatus Omnitrophica bacterium]|nr:hypothetical protein [Candidatus Omnitrophota bacterium]